MSIFRKVCTGLLLSALSFSAHAAEGDQGEGENPGQLPDQNAIDVTNTPEVIQALYVSNSSEVKVAAIVKDKAPDAADLQQYADQLTTDHNAMNEVLAALANVKSVSLKSEELSEKVKVLEKKQTEAADALAQKPAEEFRAAFLEAAIADHKAALALFDKIEEANTDDALKTTIAAFRPIVQKHLEEAEKLQQPQQPEPQPEDPTN